MNQLHDWKFGDVLKLRAGWKGSSAIRVMFIASQSDNIYSWFRGIDLDPDNPTWPEIKNVLAFELIDE